MCVPLDFDLRGGFKLQPVNGLMPIGEFSDKSGLSSKRLRTYAAEGLLVPAAVDPASGYQYYAPAQLTAAQLIDVLRQAGMPLADVRVFVRDPSQERLDDWSRRLAADSTFRQRSLATARRLLAGIEAPSTSRRNELHQEVAAMATLHTACRTETGPVRPNNEDAVLANHRLALVADGMGGHPAGEVAAHAAAGVVQAAFSGHSEDELTAAIRAANWAIWDRAAADPELEGMGTTICAAGMLDDGDLAIANVGDSRAYLWRQGALQQLTRDHSLTAELVANGELRETEALHHPYHGILTRALGVGPEVEIDSMTVGVEAGDRLVLCTDGLCNELFDPEIEKVLARAEAPSDVAQTLVQRAVEHGGHDNVSVVVIEIAA